MCRLVASLTQKTTEFELGYTVFSRDKSEEIKTLKGNIYSSVFPIELKILAPTV